jgi:hypothetical protein
MMNLYDLRREVIDFKKELINQREMIMNKLVAFKEVEMDNNYTRDYINRLMGEIKHLNLTITGVEYDIKAIQRKILDQQTGGGAE